MAGNTGGPWGGGNSDGDKPTGGGNKGGPGGPRGPRGEGPQIPEIDDLVRKGQEQLRVLMGGRKGGNRGGEGGGGNGPMLTRGTLGLGAVVALGAWVLASFYTVAPEEQGVELFLGSYYRTTDDGPHMAWWPLITAEVIDVTTNRTEEIGVRRGGNTNDGLMLTTDENIVDIDFQVVWNIKNAPNFQFSLQQPEETVRAISESAMREIIAQSELAPILNRDRAAIEAAARELIQSTLDSRETGINIIRVNFNKVDPPSQQVSLTDANGVTTLESVIDAFRDVQAAEQERDRVERQADAYANRKTAEARGESAEILEAAEGYRARVVNDAIGEASRFLAVLNEYSSAPEVTRKRLYIETMERVLGDVDKIILEENIGGGSGGGGVVPYLPLNELRRNSGGSN